MKLLLKWQNRVFRAAFIGVLALALASCGTVGTDRPAGQHPICEQAPDEPQCQKPQGPDEDDDMGRMR